jgi:hypothetical protein
MLSRLTTDVPGATPAVSQAVVPEGAIVDLGLSRTTTQCQQVSLESSISRPIQQEIPVVNIT